MARSISEVELFKDNDDKKAYLFFVKKYQKLYQFRVYAYCLMDNHVHIMIDANGCDISKAMHGINFSYAQYFNRRHKRRGHLFQDRFKSKIVLDDKYLISLSLYIHNNPTDIVQYKTHPEKYYFSSLAVYLGIRKDPFELIEDGFIMSFFGNTPKKARKHYFKLVFKCSDKKFNEEIEFEDELTEYKSERKLLVRNFKSGHIIEFIASKMNIWELKLHMKYSRELVEAKAMIVLLMRSLCNYRCSDICKILGNISQVRVSELSSLGIKLVDKKKYKDIVNEFIACYAT
jgi:REP element-mobilizing transposase RayT